MYTARWKKFKLLDLRAATGTRRTRKIVFVLFVTIGRGGEKGDRMGEKFNDRKFNILLCETIIYAFVGSHVIQGVWWRWFEQNRTSRNLQKTSFIDFDLVIIVRRVVVTWRTGTFGLYKILSITVCPSDRSGSVFSSTSRPDNCVAFNTYWMFFRRPIQKKQLPYQYINRVFRSRVIDRSKSSFPL